MKSFTIVISTILALGLTACVATENTPTPSTKIVKYQCLNSKSLIVSFIPSNNNDNGMAVINHGDKKSITLPNQVVASGFLYTNGKYTLRGKDQKVTWTIGKMMPIPCDTETAK